MKKTPKELKNALAIAGFTQAAIARELGCSPIMINNVIHGLSSSLRIQKYIAILLGSKFEDLWDEPKSPGRPRTIIPHPHLE
ncbi:MAG: helix-turn-helix transcriptional regulator [Desulfobacterales bacterium]|nr:helix-turn-helix transcriptional regulator [Desulfobacterales bacterium]